MATTVAHGLIGITVFCAVNVALPERLRLPTGPGALLGAAAIANIPDLDMLFGLLIFGNHKVLHGVTTHTLAFALVCALLVGLLWRRSASHMMRGFMILLLVGSHIVVDSLTGPQPGLHASLGTPLLWPFVSGPVQMPITVFKGVQHDNLFPGVFFTAAWELIILSPLAFFAIWLGRRCSSAHTRRTRSPGLVHAGNIEAEDSRS